MTTKDDLPFVEHILDSIQAIEIFCRDKTKGSFTKDRKTKSAVIREIEVIGEAVKNISLATKNHYGKVAWKKISGTRDKMIHHYFGVDIDIVWDIVKKHLPLLKKQVLVIRTDLKKSGK